MIYTKIEYRQKEGKQMKVFDMHCDTISAIYEKRKCNERLELRENNLHLDIEKMKKGDYGLQTFALFVDKEAQKDSFQTAQEMLMLFQKEIKKNSQEIAQVFTYKDIEENEKNGKISALLSLEEGAIYEQEPGMLYKFYEQGVRMATFTWNYENDLGYPNRFYNPLEQKVWSVGETAGLKEKGFEMLEGMEELGIIPDVSHLSDGGFYDVAKYAKRPFLASHSNARSIAPNAARNLTDDMIRILAEKGGVMGLNFCVSFVREHWKPNEEGALLSELVRQIKYIIHVGGEECLGLGSDFDGIEEVPPEMKNAEGLPFLAEAMEKEGIPYSQIEKVFFKNVKRFLKENL